MLFSLAVTAKGESPAVNPPHFMGILEVLADQTKLWKPEIFRTNRIGFCIPCCSRIASEVFYM